MKMFDGFHPVHFEALRAEKILKRDFSHMGKGDTQKIYMFPNGYGASVINSFGSFGQDELAVLWFPDFKGVPKTNSKRLRKKFMKKSGGYSISYSTPVTSDVRRYNEQFELSQDLNTISRFKVGQY